MSKLIVLLLLLMSCGAPITINPPAPVVVVPPADQDCGGDTNKIYRVHFDDNYSIAWIKIWEGDANIYAKILNIMETKTVGYTLEIPVYNLNLDLCRPHYIHSTAADIAGNVSLPTPAVCYGLGCPK